MNEIILRLSRELNMNYMDQFERILALPKTIKHLDPKIEGEAFKTMLLESGYDKTVCRSLYDYIAITTIGLKYGVHISRRTPFLLGPPGTGKTRLANQMANALNLPFISIQLDLEQSTEEDLFGRDRYSTNPTPGKVVEFITNQHQDKLKENIYPVILFFDEIDKTLNHKDSHSSRQFFLQLLSTDEKHVYECAGLGNVSLDLDKCILIFSGNERIYEPFAERSVKRRKYVEEDDEEFKNEDPAFMDRLDPVPFSPYDKQKKREIMYKLVMDIMEQFKLESILESTKDEIELDEHPGVRVLKSTVVAIIVRSIAEQEGWVF